MKEITVKSWDELHNELFTGSWDRQLERFRSPFAFRGLSNVNYDLKTSLIRLGGDFAVLERHLLRNFRKYAHRDVFERDSFWHWLSMAQHHGLPTRLLDWTYSPYVALHFATADITKFNQDAVIWMVNYIEANKFLPDTLKTNLSREGSNVFTVEMLATFDKKKKIKVETDDDIIEETYYSVEVRSLDIFDTLSSDEFLLFFEPPSIDDRIINQFALFSVISNPKTPVDEWLKKRPEVYRKIIIPANLKWEIRDKLDQANITERVLFPGLDGLAAWLKRHYSPKDTSN